MADIELVIKIDENLYRKIQSGNYGVSISNTCAYAIRNGTPLPKGHGRLIEADENLYQEIRKWVGVGVAFDIIENAPTIIEADKGDKE